jgi:hypothetical protein
LKDFVRITLSPEEMGIFGEKLLVRKYPGFPQNA